MRGQRHIQSHRLSFRAGMAARRPAVVTAYTMFLVTAALVITNPLFLVCILCACLLTLASDGRLRAAAAYVRVAIYAGITVLIINPLFSSGGIHPLLAAQLGPFHLRITWEGIAFGAGQALHLITLILAFATLTLILDQDYQLAMLSRLSARSALVVSLATRLLPVLSRDAARISDAQRSRGAELDRGRWRDRAIARGPLLAGLLTQSLERGTDVAASMESRGYGLPGRTTWRRRLRWKTTDIAVAALAGGGFICLIVGGVSRNLGFAYFPVIANPMETFTTPSSIALLAFVFVPAVWSLTWRR
ncbi:MAG: energy-coupling factor transporter transmembrane protein EcfT [Actinobacteria bacterium]|nr:energy-coupling factor transporter transmembrane protein EcfT [Actinomycetota bacterium]